MAERIPVRVLKQLRTKLGDKLAYRIDAGAPDAASRAVNSMELNTVASYVKSAEEAMEARRRELLSDPTFQNLQAQVKKLREQRSNLAGTAHRRKYTVGTANNLFFMVRAQGDTWDEVLMELEGRS